MQKYRIFIIAILLCFINIGVYCHNRIVVSNYVYTTDKIQTSFRIVQLTDLHSREFGKNNKRLINKIKDQNPDIILMTGDMLNDTDNSHDVILNFVQETLKIAPVYFSMGNHELDYKKYYDLVNDLEETNVNVMNDWYEDIKIKENMVSIFGAYSFVGVHYDESVILKLTEFCKTDNLKIIMSHDPSTFLNNDEKEWNCDIVFSGHYHGGQMRIPFLGGVRTPMGWFPEYDMGEYQKKDCTVYVSSGLGNETIIPRINNPSEILVVDVMPEKE